MNQILYYNKSQILLFSMILDLKAKLQLEAKNLFKHHKQTQISNQNFKLELQITRSNAY